MRSLSGLALVLACVAAPGAHAQSHLTRTLTARETALWEAVRAKNVNLFRNMLDPSYTGVYGSGVVDRAQELANVGAMELRSYRLSDVSARPVDPRTAVLTYKVSQQASMGGTNVSGAYWASSVWRQTRGQWRTVLHTEAKAD